MEMGLRVLLVQALQLVLEGSIASLGLHDRKWLGCGLVIRPAKGDTMTVASRVDADTDTVERAAKCIG
jgi:hypothetical protein